MDRYNRGDLRQQGEKKKKKTTKENKRLERGCNQVRRLAVTAQRIHMYMMYSHIQ